MCLVWSTTDEEDHSSVAMEVFNNRTVLNVGEWLRVEILSALRGLPHVV